MTIAKRLFTAFSAFALCAAIFLGSLSFMPKSSALDSYVFPFTESEIPSNYLDYNYYFVFANYWVNSSGVSIYYFNEFYSNSPIRITSDSRIYFTGSGSRLFYRSSDNSWNSASVALGTSLGFEDYGSPYPYAYKIDGSFTPSSSISFNYSFSEGPISSIPQYWNYQPFFFPQLPYGYFDGHINSLDGQFTLDLGQVHGTTSFNLSESGTSSDTGRVELNSGFLGVYVQENSSTGVSSGYVNTDHGEVLSGPVSTSGSYSGSVTGSAPTSLSGTAPIKYIPSYNETSRFRTWAVVSGSSYCYFVCDTRNTITGSLESVNGDKGKLRFSAVGADRVHYPFYCIEFSYDGTKLQTLSALPNGFTVDFKGGTLEQDSDSGIWSCDPLYHGFWLSDGCPPVVLSSLSNDSYKWLANPVFGVDAFTLNFLNSINENITGLRSDLSSLQSAMQSSISGQTSAFQNMDAPSASQPSTSQMMDYFSKESAFSAPNTDEVFSGDIKSGHYWDGVTWWSTKFNDIIVSNQVIVAFTTAMLTLGLAVLIIGRRFSMR